MMKFRFRRQGADPHHGHRHQIWGRQDVSFASEVLLTSCWSLSMAGPLTSTARRLVRAGESAASCVPCRSHSAEQATPILVSAPSHQGRLLTLLDDSSLHLWEIIHHNGCAHLEEGLSFHPPSRPSFDNASFPASLTRVTVVLLVAGNTAALGTESGSIFFLDVATLALLEGQTLSPDVVLRSVPDDYRCGKALGPVESLQGHLQDPSKILIGYSRGLLVIWSQATQSVDNVFLGNQQLESLCWGRDGSSIISSHSDGSYAIWSTDTGSPPTLQPTVVTTPYGPFPCKAINKILWRSCESGDHFIIFSGGMPRASYGDRHCVSVLRAETLVTLDFTSRVIDFFTVHSCQA